jgi:RHS repeat-associated protein
MAGFGVAVAGEDVYVSATVPVAADGTVSFTTTGTVDVTVDVVGVFVRPVDAWTYGYRSDGLRSSKQEAGSAPIEFSWDSSGGLPLLLAQHQGSAASYLVYGPGGTVVYQVRQDGSVLNLHHDQLGSTRLVTTGSNGSTYGTVSYDAYGRITSDSTPWFLERPLVGYTGQYHDTETGLQYLRARHYDPSTGQFLTRDPLESLTREPYAYAANNPISNTDPTGLLSWDEVGDFVDKAAPVVRRVSGVVADVAGACAVVVKAGCAQVAVGASAIKATASTYMYARGDLSRGALLTDYAQVALSALGLRASNRASALESRAAGVLDDRAARIASSSEWGTIPGLIRRGTTSPMLLRAGALRFRSSMWSSLNLLTDGIGLGLSGTGYLGC